jgi:hypothetical protein
MIAHLANGVVAAVVQHLYIVLLKHVVILGHVNTKHSLIFTVQVLVPVIDVIQMQIVQARVIHHRVI